MLSDRVAAVIPERSAFLRGYVEYASQCSDAPDIFHIGVGLTIFSAAVAKTARCPFMAGRSLVPNLYTLIVGPSRSARKTASLDIGIQLLRDANPESVIPIPGSYEELVAQLRSTPTGLLEYREFGHFLKTTVRGYGEPIRTVLMDLFDWPPDQQYVRNLKKGKTVIEAPIVLSMLSAIATDLLFKFTDTEEWTGGFFGRCLLLYGERDTFKMPTPWDEAKDYLTTQLKGWVNAAIPYCGGFHPDAWNMFTQWSQYRDSSSINAPPRVQTFFSGATTLAAKIALLYAIDQHEPMAGHGWMISYGALAKAILFVDTLYLPSIMHLGARLALGTFERDRQRILDAIEAKRGPIGRAELLRNLKISTQLLDQVVDTLRDSGEIVAGSNATGITYRKVEGGVVIPLFPNGGGKKGEGEGGGQSGAPSGSWPTG